MKKILFIIMGLFIFKDNKCENSPIEKLYLKNLNLISQDNSKFISEIECAIFANDYDKFYELINKNPDSILKNYEKISEKFNLFQKNNDSIIKQHNLSKNEYINLKKIFKITANMLLIWGAASLILGTKVAIDNQSKPLFQNAFLQNYYNSQRDIWHVTGDIPHPNAPATNARPQTPNHLIQIMVPYFCKFYKSPLFIGAISVATLSSCFAYKLLKNKNEYFNMRIDQNKSTIRMLEKQNEILEVVENFKKINSK